MNMVGNELSTKCCGNLWLNLEVQNFICLKQPDTGHQTPDTEIPNSGFSAGLDLDRKFMLATAFESWEHFFFFNIMVNVTYFPEFNWMQ